jgi:hypothetical protein
MEQTTIINYNKIYDEYDKILIKIKKYHPLIYKYGNIEELIYTISHTKNEIEKYYDMIDKYINFMTTMTKNNEKQNEFIKVIIDIDIEIDIKICIIECICNSKIFDGLYKVMIKKLIKTCKETIKEKYENKNYILKTIISNSAVLDEKGKKNAYKNYVILETIMEECDE